MNESVLLFLVHHQHRLASYLRGVYFSQCECKNVKKCRKSNLSKFHYLSLNGGGFLFDIFISFTDLFLQMIEDANPLSTTSYNDRTQTDALIQCEFLSKKLAFLQTSFHISNKYTTELNLIKRLKDRCFNYACYFLPNYHYVFVYQLVMGKM